MGTGAGPGGAHQVFAAAVQDAASQRGRVEEQGVLIGEACWVVGLLGCAVGVVCAKRCGVGVVCAKRCCVGVVCAKRPEPSLAYTIVYSPCAPQPADPVPRGQLWPTGSVYVCMYI